MLGDSQQRKAYDAQGADFHRRPETSQGHQAGMRSQRGWGKLDQKGNLYREVEFKHKNGVFLSFWVVKSYILVN